MKNKAIASGRQKQKPGLLLTQTHWEGGQKAAGSNPFMRPAGVSLSKSLTAVLAFRQKSN